MRTIGIVLRMMCAAVFLCFIVILLTSTGVAAQGDEATFSLKETAPLTTASENTFGVELDKGGGNIIFPQTKGKQVDGIMGKKGKGKQLAAIEVLAAAAAGETDSDISPVISVPSLNSFNFTGAATTSIPIIVPPGRGGIAPNLALRYNSYRYNGWVGLGWDLDIGAIQRSAKYGVDYGATDYVVVKDGAHRELAARPDLGTDYYGAKIEGDFARYYLNPSTGGWEVTTKDGTTYFYGTTPDSRQDNAHGVFKWCLDRVEDVHGNYLTVTYTKDQGAIYPLQINYTGHTGGLAPTNYVKFYLEDRPDKPLMYTTKASVKMAKRLKTIEVVADGSRTRAYKLSYTTCQGTSRSLLANCQQFGTDATIDASGTVSGGTALPPITAYYPSSSKGDSFDPVVQSTIGDTRRSFYFFDFNGDNMADAVSSSVGSDGVFVHVALSRGDGTFEAPVQTTLAETDYEGWGLGFFDVNGDGMLDAVSCDIGSDGVFCHVALSKGDGTFEDFVQTTLAETSYQDWGICLSDCDGDGMADVLIYYAGSAGIHVHVALSRGDGTFEAPVQTTLAETSYAGWGFGFVDVNGDGILDAVACSRTATTIEVRVALCKGDGTFEDFEVGLIDNRTWCYQSICYNLTFADVNGDGMADAVAYLNGYGDLVGARVFVALSKGDGTFENFVTNILAWEGYDGWIFCFPDINGDGMADATLFFGGANGIWLHVALAKGDGTFTPLTAFTPSSYPYSPSDWRAAFADVSGDGKPDVIIRTISSGAGGVSVHAALSNGPKSNLMTSISNSQGATTSFEYTSSSACQDTRFPFILHPVFRITVDVNDDLGHQSSATYSYEGGYYDPAEREFRGFEKVVATDEVTGMVTETHYHQDRIFQGRVAWSETRDVTGAAVKRVDNTWEAVDYGDDRAFPYIAQTIATRYDESGTSLGTITTAYTYDEDYGNILTEHKTTTDGYSSFTAMLYLNDTANWIIGKPTNITVREGPGSAVLRETRMEYTADARRLLKRKKRVHNGTEYTTFYEYDAYGNVTMAIDPRGFWTETHYDTDTHTFPHIITSLVTQDPSVTHQVEKTFGPGFGVVLTETDTNGQTTSYSYDVFGRETYVDYPDPSWKETIYHIEPGNHYVIVRASDAPETTVFLDNLGREIEGQVEAGGTTIITATLYDNAGRVEYKSLPFFEGGTTEYTHYEYDVRSRLIKETKPDATYRQIIYTGLQETVCDENGHSKTTTKDLLGRIKRVDEPIGGYALYAYDIFDSLIGVQDPIGNQTIITYDDLGRKVAMNDPYMGSWGYNYDEVDNLTWQKNGRDQEVVLQYDGLNRVIQKDYLTTNRQVVYDYDEARSGYYNTGRLTTVAVTTETPQIITEYNYDRMGRGVAETRGIDGTSYDFSRTYDLAGRLTSVTYPGGTQVDYAYHPIGDLHQVTKHGSSTPYAVYAAYNTMGQVGEITYGNGTKSTYTYYAKTYRIETMTTRDGADAVIQELSYGYDNAGNIQSITDSLNSVSQTFVYDEVDRLTQAAASTTDPARKYDLTYTYDLAGNMTAKTDNNDSGMGWQVLEQDSVGRPKKIDYDTAIADIGERHVEYNQDNMPTRIVFKGQETTLFYDGDNTRVKKVSGTSTVIYAGGLYEVRGGSAVLHVFGADKRIVSIEGTATYYYHTDHLNSTTVVTDVNGNRVEELGYLPFGSLLYRNAFQGGQWSTVYRFTGQEYDAEFALYNYNARLYDPIMGRFISPDHMMQDYYNPQNLNRYSYCINNPLIYIDPTGHWFGESIFKSIGGFIKGIFGGGKPNTSVTSGVLNGGPGNSAPYANMGDWAMGFINRNQSVVNTYNTGNTISIAPGEGILDEDGFLILAKLEGTYIKNGLHKPYKCEADQWTIGYGHRLTNDEYIKYKNGISQAQAWDLFMWDASDFAQTVTDNLTVNVSQNQFNALTWLSFNIGKPGFLNSSALKMINNPKAVTKYATVESAWKAWKHVMKNGEIEVSKGLVIRRGFEYDYFSGGKDK